MDSDLDPDEMLTVYMKAKARLFDRSPDLVPEPEAGSKRSTKQKSPQKAATHQTTPGEATLQQRLQSIEADPLFDRVTADTLWREQRLDMVRDRAERQRLGVSRDAVAKPGSGVLQKKNAKDDSTGILDEAEALGKKLLEEAAEAEDADVLGGMFDMPAESETHTTRRDGLDNSLEVTTRNFGKITGISPRRILEDACKSR